MTVTIMSFIIRGRGISPQGAGLQFLEDLGLGYLGISIAPGRSRFDACQTLRPNAALISMQTLPDSP
ncbi:hypothetical protein PCO31110_00341 [Pandoraea communis]|uniref:Uncharacterized protein n=1 Tax=Pandoraea communis TaxID=2508297 RepID=A0A5E4RQU8_9BURK|nr:hypothetical protein PCO31110_00341 [Pandoraea communis]